MKKALLALLLVPFFSVANVYDGASSVSPDIQSESKFCNNQKCDNTTWFFDDIDSYLAFIKEDWHNRFPTEYLSSQTFIKSTDYGSSIKHEYSFYRRWVSNDGWGSKTYPYFYETQIENKVCPLPYTIEVDQNQDGEIDICYDPSTINDSCDSNDIYPMDGIVSNGGLMCMTKPDGSQCMYNSNFGDYMYSTGESCFDQEGQDVPQVENGNGDCRLVGTNSPTSFCNVQPEDVCSGGTAYGGAEYFDSCQSGCGFFNGEFGCFTSDSDSDGLPDITDPDIDNDGIPNYQDPDYDGDGIDDPQNSIYRGQTVTLSNSTTNILNSNTNFMTSQIVNNINNSSNEVKNQSIQNTTNITNNDNVNTQLIIDAINANGGTGDGGEPLDLATIESNTASTAIGISDLKGLTQTTNDYVAVGNSLTEEGNGLLATISNTLIDIYDQLIGMDEQPLPTTQEETDNIETALTEFSDKTSEQLGYVDELKLSNSSSLHSNLPTGQCQNYSMDVGGWYTFVLDLCEIETKVKPFINWIIGMLTAWYIFRLVNRTFIEVHS